MHPHQDGAMWNLRQWNSHSQRLVTGLSMAIPVALLLLFGPFWSWCLVVTLMTGVSLWEYQRMTFPEETPQTWRAFFIATGLIFPAAAALGETVGLHCALVLALFAGFLCILFLSPEDPGGIRRLSQFSLGWLYIPYLLSYILLVGQDAAGSTWIFFTLLVMAASDAGAFYTGKHLGRHKLYERVSPKKTVEGSLGGLLASMLVGAIFARLFIDNPGFAAVFFFSGFLALVGQMGDLMESLVKRLCGKKDSSELLPGHGGLLDRLDSLFFAFPTTYLFLQWMVDR